MTPTQRPSLFIRRFSRFHTYIPTSPRWLLFCAHALLLWPYLAAPAPPPNYSASICTDSHLLRRQCVSERSRF